jgi:hypothetical protein
MAQLTSRPSRWNNVLRLGALAALGSVLVGLIEMVITFLPGGNTLEQKWKPSRNLAYPEFYSS